MDSAQKNVLKAQAHHLKPVILVGSKGVTKALIEETNHALQAHELIKIKVIGEDKLERTQMAESICAQLHAEFLQLLGHVAIIYRKKIEQN